MPSSEPLAVAPPELAPGATGAPRAWRRPLLAGAAVLALLLAFIAGRVVWFDAYWLFRDRPPWLAETGGSNRLLDRQTRRGKTLQALTRSYSVALLGSSTVYSGLDPADVDPAWRGRTFNAGISGIQADELPVIASLVASRSGVERVVLGLDYYMFSRSDRPVRLDAALATPIGRANALLGSVWSRYALFDSWIVEVAGNPDPGAWTYGGFRAVPPLPPALTVENDRIRRRTTRAFRPETLDAIDATLDRLGSLPLRVYLAPISPAQRRLMTELGLEADLARWREAVARKLGGRGVRVLDLVDLGDRYPFDPAAGSTAAWLDNLHFTPLIGRQVLAAVGLRTGP